MFLLSLGAMADGTEKIDGKTLSKITFDGDNVILHYKDGTTADLTKDMATIVIDLGDASGINTVRQIESLKNKGVYNLQGQYLGQGVEGLKKGLYIVDGKKVIIK